ncbi:MAG: hypothetical protein AAGF32_01230 [Pseudomonadota bacterium]
MRLPRIRIRLRPTLARIVTALLMGCLLALPLLTAPSEVAAQRAKKEDPRTTCRQFSDLPDVQVRAMIDLVRDTKADTLDQGFAFSTLLCARRETVRELALRAALAATDNPAVRSVALLQVLMSRDVLVMEFERGAGVDADTASFIREAGGSIGIPLVKHNRKQKTIGLFRGSTRNLLDISGTRVTFRYSDRRRNTYRAELALADGGVLRGTFYGDGITAGTPVVVKIY